MKPHQPPASHPQANHRRTIGYMTNGIYAGGGKGGYHFSLWRGIRDTAAARDINVVCFIGGTYRITPSFEYEYQRNNVFDLVSNEYLDGLIIGSAALVSALGSQELARYYSNFSRQPIVSIGLQLENFPRLFVDNYSGARQIVDHLIDQHACRRIAYIRGPIENEEAAVRYQAYLDSLRDHGIPLDPALVLPGDFNRPSGESAALLLLDTPHTGFDALVAANDNMALGAISALRSRGVVVPDQVAVVGFDDIPDSVLSFPPLTTVRQPIYEVGQKAVELLLAAMDGGEVQPQVSLPTSLAVRNSCGCSIDLISPRPVSAPLPAKTRRRSSAGRAALLESMLDALGCTPSQRPSAARQAGELLDAVTQVLETGGQDAAGLNRLAQSMNLIMEQGPLLPWHRAVSVLSRSGLAASKSVPWQAVWQLTSETAWFSQSIERLSEHYQEEQQSELLRGISQALVTTFNLPELMETISRLFPRLGIVGCWIFLSDQPGALSQPARLRLAYNRSGRIDLPEEGEPVPARWIIPADLQASDQAFIIIANSLYYGETNFGFALFEMDEPNQKILDMLTSQISTALQGARVVDELRRMEAEIRLQANTDPLTGIYNRRMLYALGEPAFVLASRHNLPLSVAVIDIDNFKSVNDQFGHAVGDQVLCKFTAFIKNRIRGADIFGRYGGEEFVIILPETSAEGALAFVDRMRKSIQDHPINVGGLTIRLTVSIGLASLAHDRDQIIDNLIDNADKALYQAKQAGKNQVALFAGAHHP